MLAAVALAQTPQTFQREVKVQVSGQYLVYLPEGYDPKSRQKWPLIMFLHGAGERGSDLNMVKVHGIPKEIERGRKVPAVVIAPQCPADSWWDVNMLVGLLDEAERRYKIDRDREIVTGLSMGGYASWDLASRFPHRFAAIAPVCGGGDPTKIAVAKDLPLWTTHGDADQSVPVAQTDNLVAALKAAGATNVRYDRMPGVPHDSWTAFYAQDELYTWLLAQKRKH